MREIGQLSRARKKWESKFQSDCHVPEDIKPLAIGNVSVAFLMLLAAIVTTPLLIQLERNYLNSLGRKSRSRDEKNYNDI